MDIESLEKSFNLDDVKFEVKALKDRIKNLEACEDPTQILQANIARANLLLDRLEDSIDAGETPKGGVARIVEVAGQLINSVTTAASTMMTLTFSDRDAEYKDKILSLKELEVQAKIAGKSTPQAITQNNTLILTDRNSLLEALNREDDPLIIDTTEVKELK